MEILPIAPLESKKPSVSSVKEGISGKMCIRDSLDENGLGDAVQDVALQRLGFPCGDGGAGFQIGDHDAAVFVGDILDVYKRQQQGG